MREPGGHPATGTLPLPGRLRYQAGPQWRGHVRYISGWRWGRRGNFDRSRLERECVSCGHNQSKSVESEQLPHYSRRGFPQIQYRRRGRFCRQAERYGRQPDLFHFHSRPVPSDAGDRCSRRGLCRRLCASGNRRRRYNRFPSHARRFSNYVISAGDHRRRREVEHQRIGARLRYIPRRNQSEEHRGFRWRVRHRGRFARRCLHHRMDRFAGLPDNSWRL